VRLVPIECVTRRVDSAGNLYEEKTPWKEIIEHYHGHYRLGGICSGGPFFFDRNKREPCHGCDLYWNAPKGRKNKPISMSNKFGFGVLVMEPFHKVPQIDRNTGQFSINPNTQQPYTNWDRCLGQGCPSCQQALETVQGRMQPWIMSKTHFNNLNAYSDRLGCLTCGARSTPDNRPVISTAFWQCGNPACRQLIFDMNNTTATLEQIRNVVNYPYTCPFCGMVAYPEEVIQCANCTPAGAVPVRASIFDVDLQVIAPKTGDNDATTLTVLASSDPRPLAEMYAPLMQYTPDLEKILAPTPLEKQAEMWRCGPSSVGQPQHHAQAYGQPQQPGAGVPPGPAVYGQQAPQPMPQPGTAPVQPQPYIPPGSIGGQQR
jgi:hypothetical protein